jgi:hypothetical protein
MALFKSRHHGLIVCVWPDPSQDDSAAIESFSKSMESQGYELRKAVSTPQGIELIAGGKPDLVLVYDDPSTVATLKGDSNFTHHYQPKPGSDLQRALLFERIQ